MKNQKNNSEQTYDENYKLIHGKDIYIEDSIEDIEEMVNAEVNAKVDSLRARGVRVLHVPTESEHQVEWLQRVKGLATKWDAKYVGKEVSNA